MKKIGFGSRIVCVLFGIVAFAGLLGWAYITMSWIGGLYHATAPVAAKIGHISWAILMTLPVWLLVAFLAGCGVVAVKQAITGRE